MEKFKDFIYDKNDILIAFAVLIVAALIIFWRMDVLMDYPNQVLNEGEQTVITHDKENKEESDEKEGESVEKEDESTDKKDDSNDKTDESADKKDESNDKTDETESTPAPLWSDGKTTRDITVTVAGNSAYEAIGTLINAGIFKDYDEYMSICKDLGLNHEKVYGDTYLFEKGTTKEEIADAVNWS